MRAQSADPTVESFVALEELFRAIRKELGHRDGAVRKGLFVGFLLRRPDLLYEAIRLNPKTRLKQLAEMEIGDETEPANIIATHGPAGALWAAA